MRRAGITEAEIIQLTLENVRSFYHRNPEVTTRSEEHTSELQSR